MPALTYPVRVDATLESPLSRWMWLVKWLLAIPHYLILVFLWLGLFVASVAAFFAILVTGRYPRPLFDFNVGVLRWTWRVEYYTYGALATDRYPPFTLADVPGYPARLEVAYPEHLSRGLVLVKWWLLAIPHYIIVGVFVGGGGWAAVLFATENANWLAGGLIGLLVLVAGIVLLFTGRYPQSIYDFVLGMNRWVLRVAAYATLMTDAYPPFRLDMGGPEPGATVIIPPPQSPDGEPVGGHTGGGPVPRPAAPPKGGWTGGRVVSLVVGSVLVLVSLGLFAAGGVALWASQDRDGGYLTSGEHSYTTAGYAITTDRIDLGEPGWPSSWQSDLIGTVRIRATNLSAQTPLFIGIGPSRDVESYLHGVRHSKLADLGDGHDAVVVAGAQPAGQPGDQTFWSARSDG